MKIESIFVLALMMIVEVVVVITGLGCRIPIWVIVVAVICTLPVVVSFVWAFSEKKEDGGER